MQILADYYTVLGVARDATIIEIKTQFRLLARKYHPDVDPAPDAAARFREVSDAYNVVGDPERRRLYDAELRLADFKRNPGSPGAGGSSTPGPPFGHHSAPSAAPFAQQPAPANRPSTAARPPESQPLLDQATASLKLMRFREAERMCNAALREYGRQPRTYELLGDVAVARGDIDTSIAMYTYAVQLANGDPRIRAKLDRVTGTPSGPIITNPERRAVDRKPGAGPRLNVVGGVTSASASAITLGFAIAIAANGGAAAHSLNPVRWSFLLLLGLVTAGATWGFALAMLGWLPLCINEMKASPDKPEPSGAAITVAAMVSPIISAALLAIRFTKPSGHPWPLVRVMAAMAFLVVIFGMASPTTSLPIVLFGGNLVLPAITAGWAAADVIRELG